MITKIKKGSILKKMIFLNTINILAVVVAIVIVVMFFIFSQFEKALISETETSVKTFSNVFKNIQNDLSRKAGKYTKDRDVIMAVTNSVMKEETYREVKKETLENGKLLYSYVYTDISGNRKYSMKRLANLLIDFITGGGRRFGVNELFLTIVDHDGKCLGTSMLVPEQKPFDVKDNSDLINKILNINTPFKNLTTDAYYEVASTDEGLVVRGGTSLRYEKESMGAIIISQVIEKEMVNYISSQIKMKPGTHIFFLLDNKYLVGELELEKGYEMFSMGEAYDNLKSKDYFIGDINIKGEEFVTAYYAIRDINNKVIGFMGIANSKEQLNKAKFLTIIIIASVSFFIILIGVIINTFISYRIAKPLMKLQETANRIAEGRYSEVFENSKESNEIAALSESLQNMLGKINDNIRKIRAIEEIVSIIHQENDDEKVLFYILSIIASKKGLDCRKSAYFEYEQGNNLIYGRSFSVSELVDREGKDFRDIYEEKTEALVENKRKIASIAIDCSENRILADVISLKKVVYAPGDSFRVPGILELGFSGVFIIPVIYEERIYGMMIIEAPDEHSSIFDEEADIINMFATNLAIYFENKRLGSESLKTEKLTTMMKMASSIVHELRTPLTSIRGFADMLRKNCLTDTRVQRYTEFIINDSKRIDGLAEDLLDYAEGAKYKYEMKRNDLRKVLMSVIEELKNDISANNITLEFDVAASIGVHLDEVRFKKAIYNMVKNSIEAAKGRNDLIIIRGYIENKRPTLKITDNGVGIPKEIINMVFEPLVTTKIQGTGLGLTISKEILDSHGYEMNIKSEANVGTEITILM